MSALIGELKIHHFHHHHYQQQRQQQKIISFEDVCNTFFVDKLERNVCTRRLDDYNLIVLATRKRWSSEDSVHCRHFCIHCGNSCHNTLPYVFMEVGRQRNVKDIFGTCKRNRLQISTANKTHIKHAHQSKINTCEAHRIGKRKQTNKHKQLFCGYLKL